ncbi:MgtC/SapB family protein [Noviherbaspirillum sp.]|uniref:MgtC/SapB family protein n=1 Tax=Noviherbaspirillum sp. TaxID=1926288 RepID=UPI002D512A0C|nr:MgtC/SapB family protein [Noviherbaspirillum sp.]HZW22515.1 MgtC/SapB family protein [Noviherbaspirillum sp.]
MPGWWDVVLQTLEAEFSDLSEPAQFARMAVRLLLAVILGAMLGLERELRGMAAGLRTHMLVALGSALFVVVPLQSGMEADGVSRVLQGVISGIGFLGAGAIVKLSGAGEIRGLTTAASVWLTSAIGITAGMGREMTAVLTTLLALAILTLSHLNTRPERPDD